MHAFLLTAILWETTAVAPADVASEFESRTVTIGRDGAQESFGYRLLKPATIEPGKKYPLIVFLHGAGERGDDNTKQLMYFPEQMASAEWRAKYPCFLLAPQCPAEKWWAGRRRGNANGDNAESDQLEVVERMLTETIKDQPIDTKRVYLTGLSMGGFGSWEWGSRRPTWFAAVAPICGGGNVETAKALKDTPVWAFHGDADAVVPVERSREMVEAVRTAGGSPKYTEQPGVGHNSWTPAYSDPQGLVPWMFEQVNDRGVAGEGAEE